MAMTSTLAVLMVAEHLLFTSAKDKALHTQWHKSAPSSSREAPNVQGHNTAETSRSGDRDLEAFFMAFDIDENGQLDMAEFTKAFGQQRYTPDQLKVLYSVFDKDHSGGVSVSELRAGGRELASAGARRSSHKIGRPTAQPVLNSTTIDQYCVYHVHGFTHSGTGVYTSERSTNLPFVTAACGYRRAAAPALQAHETHVLYAKARQVLVLSKQDTFLPTLTPSPGNRILNPKSYGLHPLVSALATCISLVVVGDAVAAQQRRRGAVRAVALPSSQTPQKS